MASKKIHPEIVARLEILDADDDNPIRKTVALSPAEKATLEAEKRQLLAGMSGPRLDDSPRARRLGRTRPEGAVDPDAPGVEDDAVPPGVVPSEDDVMSELRARSKANLGITPGRASRAPEPVDVGDADDVSPERRQLDLSPDEIAQLEAERSQLVAQIRASRPAEADVVDEPTVVEGDIDIPSSPELEAAAAAVAEVDAEIATFEAERRAAEKQRIEEQKAAELAHKERIAALKVKHDAAEAVRQRALQKQASVELKLRAEKARQAAAKELERRARVQSDLNERLRARVQPALDRCRAELIELEEFAKENEKTLAALSAQSWRTCSSFWPMELRMEFQREVSGNAYKLMMDLKRSLDAYPRHVKTLEAMTAAGYQENQEQVYVQALYDASIGIGITRVFREQLTRLNEILTDVNDRGSYADSIGTVHVIEEPAITKDHQEHVKQQLLRGGEPSQQTHAITHPSQEASARETNEAILRRMDGAVRQA